MMSALDMTSTPRNEALRYDPLSPEALVNPYPFYRQLQEVDPIHWGSADDANLPGRWYVLRYADVMAILRDARFGREVERYLPPAQVTPRPPADHLLGEVAQGWMILRDPPVHTRLRALVSHAYTPRRVQQLSPKIDATARRLIGQMRQSSGTPDLLTAFALPLTVYLTGTMLGLPTDTPEQLEQLTDWSRALAAVIDLNQAEPIRQRSRIAVQACTDYVQTIIAQRRAQPQDDLISALLQQTQGAPENNNVSDAELVGTVTHLIFVGNDPVMHMIGNAVITLATHPDQRAWLLAHPDCMEGALDEIMRYDSPVQMTFRYALTDVEYGGKQLHTGDHVAVVLGAANRDPAQFPDADTLDLMRPVGLPAHFGMGIHYCLGAPLARLEGQIALRALLEELPELQHAVDLAELTWQPTVAVRGVTTLPIQF